MKSILHKTYILLGVLTVSVLFSACKKEEPANVNPADLEAPLNLHIDTEFNGNALAAGETYTAGSTLFRLDGLAFYINSVELVREDGSVYRLPENRVFYANLTGGGHNHDHAHAHKAAHGDHSYVDIALGNVPRGNYAGIRFKIGHSSMTGHNGPGGAEGKVQPTDFPADHALAPQDPSMWWSWATGYIFFRLDGVVDTNNNGVIDPVGEGDTHDRNMQVHLGNSGMIAEISSTADRAFTVGNAGGECTVYFDFSDFFTGINLREEHRTHSMGNGTALAERYRDNLNAVFSTPLFTN